MAAMLVSALVAVVVVRGDEASEPAPRDARVVGRFYPPLSGSSRVRLVLPSGVAVVLSGDTGGALDGLGATFAGAVGSVAFRIVHGSPSELFATLAPGPIPHAVGVAGAYARAPDLSEFGGRFAVMSRGAWTLVAFLSDDEEAARYELREVQGWRLRSTHSGAVVRAPHLTTGDAAAVLFDDSDRPVRRVELTADNCVATAQRHTVQSGDSASASWCRDGLNVRLSGPESFVAHAVTTLRVDVERDAGVG
jgi:hypothetical protein